MVSKKWRIDFSQFSSANSMHVKMLESCACLLPGDFPDVLLCVYIFLIATCLRTCLVGGTVSKYVVVQWRKIDTNTDTSSSSSINALAVLASGVRRWVLRTVSFHRWLLQTLPVVHCQVAFTALFVHTHPPLPTTRYSFIQPWELEQWRQNKLVYCYSSSTHQESPTWERICRLYHCTPQGRTYSTSHIMPTHFSFPTPYTWDKPQGAPVSSHPGLVESNLPILLLSWLIHHCHRQEGTDLHLPQPQGKHSSSQMGSDHNYRGGKEDFVINEAYGSVGFKTFLRNSRAFWEEQDALTEGMWM